MGFERMAESFAIDVLCMWCLTDEHPLLKG